MNERTKRLRGVVVGAGYFSKFHLSAWSRIDEVEIVALCDLDQEKAQRVAGVHGITNVYNDVSRMLSDQNPDFVDIVTRPDSHLDLVRSAADAGVSIICQKPLAPTFDDARRLVSVASDARVLLMVHENFRFQPWYREIRKLLDDGVVGDNLHTISIRTRMGDGWQNDAYQARQPYFVSMPQLLIFETGVHFIDTFRYLAGEIDGIYASLRRLNPNIAGEDTAMVLFEFANGAQGVWDASRYHESNLDDPRYTFGECLVETNGGSIRLYGDGRITIQKLGQSERDHPYEHNNLDFAGDCVFATQQHFIDSIRKIEQFETSGEEYLKTLCVQEAVYQSAASGLPVRGLAEGGDHADH